MKQLSIDEDETIVYTNDITVNYFNMKNKSKYRIETTRDHIRQVSTVFFFNKNSILSHLFNQKIYICQESGLTFHWLSKYKSDHKNKEFREPRKLGIQNIVAVLQISAVLCVISIIVFVLEIMSTHNATIKKFLNFLTY